MLILFHQNDVHPVLLLTAFFWCQLNNHWLFLVSFHITPSLAILAPSSQHVFSFCFKAAANSKLWNAALDYSSVSAVSSWLTHASLSISGWMILGGWVHGRNNRMVGGLVEELINGYLVVWLLMNGWVNGLTEWLASEWMNLFRFAWEWMVCWWNGWFAGTMNLCIDGGCRMAGGWSDTTGAQISSDRTWLVVLSAFPTVQSKVHARTESEQLSHDSYLAGHYSSGLAMMKLCNMYSRSRLDLR